MSGTTKRRVLYLATAVAVLGMSGGFVLAAGLTSTIVSQTGAMYTVNTSSSASFPTTPTVVISSTPVGVVACTAAAQTLANSVTVNIELPASTGIVCTAGNFAEEFSFTSLATAAAGTYLFTEYTTYGAGPTSGSATGTVTVAAVMSISGSVNIFVDYGTSPPPVGGIATLSLVVH